MFNFEIKQVPLPLWRCIALRFLMKDLKLTGVTMLKLVVFVPLLLIFACCLHYELIFDEGVL